MPYVSQQDLEKFDQEMRQAFQRVGGGKITIESNAVRAAVRSNKAAAYRYVELHCHMAASQPGYLQPAIIVATAYQIEFKDETLVNLVMKRAKELNAMEHLESIGFGSGMADLQKTPPKSKPVGTIVVMCKGQDGKGCSIIQIDDATEEDLKRGFTGKCPRCGKEFRVDRANISTFHLD